MALDLAKEVGPDLYRGLMLAADLPAYAATDLVTACTELMALMSMVSFMALLFFVKQVTSPYLYFCTKLFLPVAFQATPWTAIITDKVQGMQGKMKTVDELQSRVTKAEEELARMQKELETVSGQASTLSADKI